MGGRPRHPPECGGRCALRRHHRRAARRRRAPGAAHAHRGVGAGGPSARAREPDRHGPRRRGARAVRGGARVPPRAPRGRGLGPSVRPEPCPRGPERPLRARRAPLPARDPRPVLCLLPPPGHAADRHRGHGPTASPARGDFRGGLARAQQRHRPLHSRRGAGRSRGGCAGRSGALGAARAVSPPAWRLRRRRQRGAVHRPAALGRRRRARGSADAGARARGSGACGGAVPGHQGARRHRHPAVHDRAERPPPPGAPARLGGGRQPRPRRAGHDRRRAGGHGAPGDGAPAPRAPARPRAPQPTLLPGTRGRVSSTVRREPPRHGYVPPRCRSLAPSTLGVETRGAAPRRASRHRCRPNAPRSPPWLPCQHPPRYECGPRR